MASRRVKTSAASRPQMRQEVEQVCSHAPQTALDVIRTWVATDDAGKRRGATLLIVIDPDIAAQLIKRFRETELALLTLEISRIETVSPEETDRVLAAFLEMSRTQKYVAQRGIDYARELLNRSLGADRATEIVNLITISLQVQPFDFIRNENADHLFNFLEGEHSQTIALVLYHLAGEGAARIIERLGAEKGADVLGRIAELGHVRPEVLRDIERVLERKFSHVSQAADTVPDGRLTARQILKDLGRGHSRYLKALHRRRPDLARDLVRKPGAPAIAAAEPARPARAITVRPARALALPEPDAAGYVTSEQAAVLRRLQQDFAIKLTMALAARLSFSIGSTASPVVLAAVQGEDLLEALEAPSLLALADLTPLKGKALLQIDSAICFAIVERCFGGADVIRTVNRELTDIERVIMERIFLKVLSELKDAWSPVADVRPRLEAVEADAALLKDSLTGSGLVTVVPLKAGSIEGSLRLFLPDSMVRSLAG